MKYTVNTLDALHTRYHEGNGKLLGVYKALNDLIESGADHDGLLYGVQAIITDARAVMDEMGQVVEMLVGELRYGQQEQEGRPKGKLMVVV